jgi:N-carbamoyl-L-amino-acid hydrolase
MPLRADALAAAARLISGVQALALATPGAVGTVGRLALEPNIINTIPGRVVMSADFRHALADELDRLVARLEGLAAEVVAETGVAITLDRFWTSEPTPFDPDVVTTVQAAADEMGFPSRRLWSGAGHDAKYAQEIWPSAMIFVRSAGGLSHSEQELSTTEDLAAGADVLLYAALKLAGTAERVR